MLEFNRLLDAAEAEAMRAGGNDRVLEVVHTDRTIFLGVDHELKHVLKNLLKISANSQRDKSKAELRRRGC